MDSLPQRIGISATQEVDGDRKDSTDDEEIQKSGVPDVIVEIATRPDRTPNQGGIEVRLGKWAAKSIRGRVGADMWDMVESPVENPERR